MSETIDRMWNIRDAVLAWLYEQAAADNHVVAVDLDALQECTGWKAEPITAREADKAMAFLIEQGLAKGTIAMGGHVLRPSITSSGDNQAATGLSVKPGPPKEANTTGVTNNYTFNNHGPSNNAVNSSDVTQAITVGEQSDRILAVADALEKYVAEAPANAAQAQDVIAGLRVEGSDPVGNKNKLMAYLSNAIATVSLAAGTEIGQQVTELAVSAIQSLG